MQTLPHARPGSQRKTGKDKAKELRQRVDDSLDTLARAVDEVRASETFKAYLEVQARFHKYSWHNSMLILSQRPDATRIAGFRAWQKLGRHVCKGERGIMIFAPRPYHKEVERDDGETETLDGVSFRPVYVFDESQTEVKAFPEIDLPTVDSAADDLLDRLTRVARERSIAVEFAKLSGGLFGVSKGGSVEVDNGHATEQQAKTLAHELAHEALHNGEKRKGLTRTVAELEAESVAYVVCTHFGLDVAVRETGCGRSGRGTRTSIVQPEQPPTSFPVFVLVFGCSWFCAFGTCTTRFWAGPTVPPQSNGLHRGASTW